MPNPAEMLARPASEGLVCRVCGGPTENVHGGVLGVPIAYPCGPSCTAELRRIVRSSIHARCCGRTEPPFCQSQTQKVPSLRRFRRAFGDLATDNSEQGGTSNVAPNQHLLDRIAVLEDEVEQLRRPSRPAQPQPPRSATRNEPPPDYIVPEPTQSPRAGVIQVD